MVNSYWSQVLNARVSRRRALAAAGAASVGAGFLAACGGEDSSSTSGGASGLLTKPVDTSKEARRGGTLNLYKEWDLSSVDPATAPKESLGALNRGYSKLFYVKPGYLAPSAFEVAGDVLESWEWSPDGLTLTGKLRQGVGYAPLPPLNGRNVDVEDIAFTFKRYAAKGVNRSDYFNSLNADAPIVSVTTPDSRTIVMKMAFPTVGMIARLGGSYRPIWIIPKEGDSEFDFRTKVIGSGPYYVDEYVPSSHLTSKRNPNYYDKTLPYIEEVREPILPEYATRLAQLRTGNIYTITGLRPEDVLPTKRDTPALNVYAGDIEENFQWIFFGWKPLPPEKTPFRDERVRQGYSMALDRDTYMETFFNASNFEAEGLPVQTRWHTVMSSAFDGWWLDPKGKEFGANAKYFQHSVPEAKKLLAAAGYPNGLEVASNWPIGLYNHMDRRVTVMEGMVSEAGFSFKTNNPQGTSEWYSKFRDAQGNFEGVAYRGLGFTIADAVERLVIQFSSSKLNTSFTGFDSEGRGDFSGDKEIEAMVFKARGEFDTEKRRALVFDIQRLAAKKQYNIIFPGSANEFLLAWPALQNFNVYRGSQSSGLPHHEWIDESKPPFKKA